jgi:hypothetical protein
MNSKYPTEEQSECGVRVKMRNGQCFRPIKIRMRQARKETHTDPLSDHNIDLNNPNIDN